MNYKGGVGKTTLAANISAELAIRGFKVLMIDLDPQANLTLSFVNIDEWKDLDRHGRTIKHWYDDFLDRDGEASLHDLIITPNKVRRQLKKSHHGRIDLICSHLELIHVDMELASRLGGTTDRTIRSNYLKVLSRLRIKLDEIKDEYDMVIIDCPPNFNLVTQNALAASDAYIVPAKADYLSTLGIQTLTRHVNRLEEKYNQYSSESDPGVMQPISPKMLGVVFTMMSFRNKKPIAALKEYMNQVEKSGYTCFRSVLRESKSLFASAPESGIPAILTKGSNLSQEKLVRGEIKQIVSEMLDFYYSNGGESDG